MLLLIMWLEEKWYRIIDALSSRDRIPCDERGHSIDCQCPEGTDHA